MKLACAPLKTRFTFTISMRRSLRLLGLDHTRLTYFFQGREHRLTDIGGDNDLAPRLVKG